jgi:hypothetical protein
MAKVLRKGDKDSSREGRDAERPGKQLNATTQSTQRGEREYR